MALKASKIIVNIITVAVLFLFVVTWALPKIGYRPYNILTASMYPYLNVGEIVLIDTNDNDIEIDDVVAYQAGNSVVVHRVVRIDEDGKFITRGDANPSEDFRPLGTEDIVGTAKIGLGPLSSLWKLVASGGRFVLLGVVVLLNIAVEVPGKKNKEEGGKVDGTDNEEN